MLDLGTAVGYLMLDTSGVKKGVNEARSYFNTIMDSATGLNDRLSATSKLFSTVGSAMTKYISVPLAGLATGAVLAATEYGDAMKDMQTKTGASREELEKFKGVLNEVYAGGYGEGYRDIANAIALVDQQLGELSDEELVEVTEGALLLRDTFEYDLNESIRATQSLVQNFGITTQGALDYIAYGAQNGLDYSNELLDTINEYSPQFKKLGFDAADMFNTFIAGAQNGAFNLDKVGDALKELSIRAIDMSATTTQAYETLGLNANQIANQFAQGGESAKNATYVIIEALKQIDDPIQQNLAGVNLFGTMWEDLGPDVVLNLTSIKDAADAAFGSLDEINNVNLENPATQLELAKRSFSEAATAAGIELLPAMTNVLNTVTGVAEKFNSLDDNTKKFLITAGTIAFVFGPVLVILGQLANAIILISGALGVLGISASTVMPYILAAVAAIALLVGLIAILKGSKSDLESLKDIENQIPSVGTRNTTGVPRGSYASGLDYVPRDMPVNVHEGEAILTKEENKKRNSTPQKQEFTINSPVYLSGREIGRSSYKFIVQEGKLIGPSLVGGETL